MFAYIKGSLEMKSNGYIVIDINGLGYKIFMSQNNIDSIGEIHNIIKLKLENRGNNYDKNR